MPSPEKINILAQTMSLFGLKAYRIRQGLKVKDISDILEQIKGTDISSIVSNQVLRSMSKARYFEEPLGHLVWHLRIIVTLHLQLEGIRTLRFIEFYQIWFVEFQWIK